MSGKRARRIGRLLRGGDPQIMTINPQAVGLERHGRLQGIDIRCCRIHLRLQILELRKIDLVKLRLSDHPLNLRVGCSKIDARLVRGDKKLSRADPLIRGDNASNRNRAGFWIFQNTRVGNPAIREVLICQHPRKTFLYPRQGCIGADLRALAPFDAELQGRNEVHIDFGNIRLNRRDHVDIKLIPHPLSDSQGVNLDQIEHVRRNVTRLNPQVRRFDRYRIAPKHIARRAGDVLCPNLVLRTRQNPGLKEKATPLEIRRLSHHRRCTGPRGDHLEHQPRDIVNRRIPLHEDRRAARVSVRIHDPGGNRVEPDNRLSRRRQGHDRNRRKGHVIRRNIKAAVIGRVNLSEINNPVTIGKVNDPIHPEQLFIVAIARACPSHHVTRLDLAEARGKRVSMPTGATGGPHFTLQEALHLHREGHKDQLNICDQPAVPVLHLIFRVQDRGGRAHHIPLVRRGIGADQAVNRVRQTEKGREGLRLKAHDVAILEMRNRVIRGADIELERTANLRHAPGASRKHRLQGAADFAVNRDLARRTVNRFGRVLAVDQRAALVNLRYPVRRRKARGGQPLQAIKPIRGHGRRCVMRSVADETALRIRSAGGPDHDLKDWLKQTGNIEPINLDQLTGLAAVRACRLKLLFTIADVAVNGRIARAAVAIGRDRGKLARHIVKGVLREVGANLAAVRGPLLHQSAAIAKPQDGFHARRIRPRTAADQLKRKVREITLKRDRGGLRDHAADKSGPVVDASRDVIRLHRRKGITIAAPCGWIIPAVPASAARRAIL